MKRGRVIGQMWSTKGNSKLMGVKLLLIAVCKPDTKEFVPSGQVIVARDDLEAGVGQIVLVAFGSGARRTISAVPNTDVLADAAVVQIVDDWT